MTKHDDNLIVIGAGSAGLIAALVAATARAKVTLVERAAMGGDCLNTCLLYTSPSPRDPE